MNECCLAGANGPGFLHGRPAGSNERSTQTSGETGTTRSGTGEESERRHQRYQIKYLLAQNHCHYGTVSMKASNVMFQKPLFLNYR